VASNPGVQEPTRHWRARAAISAIGAALLASAAWLVVKGPAPELPPPDAQVGFQEYSIAMTDRLASGEVVLELVNNGHAHHNFTLCPANEDGDGCGGRPLFFDMLRRPAEARDQSFYDDRADSIVIGKRWTALIAFDLEPGTYYAYCAIYTHDARGMNTTITVSEATVEG
jgi:plastocyanin